MGCTRWIAFVIILPILVALLLQWIYSVDIESYYKDKRIIITGASQGIGKDLAIRLAQLGSRLVIAARTESKLKETQKLCKQYSQDVFTVKADVGVEEDNKLIVNEAVKQLGGIDIIILNAAYSPPPTLFTEYENPGQLFLDVYKVNVLQGAYLIQHSLDYLRESHGVILAVSSLAGWVGTTSFTAYSASKHALHGFFSTLNMELEMRQENISVVIMPIPYVLTDRAVGAMKHKSNNWGETLGITSEDCADRMVKGLPLNRLYYYITWEAYFIGHLYSLCPYCFDYMTTAVMQLISDAIK